MNVTISRRNWGGPDVPGRVRVTVGPVGNRFVDGSLVFGMTKVTASRTWTVHSKSEKVLTLPTPPPPFEVKVHVDPPFVPSELDPNSQDTRKLGAQVMFDFKPF
jgi:hypothetical protein